MNVVTSCHTNRWPCGVLHTASDTPAAALEEWGQRGCVWRRHGRQASC